MGVVSSFGSESGRPEIDRQKCTDCGLCAEVCPTRVLQKRDGKLHIQADSGFGCIACLQCGMVCPRQAVAVRGRRAEPEHLAAFPADSQPASAPALEALMARRRSIRGFTQQPVTREEAERVVAAAAMAPMGIPPWDVGVAVFLGKEKVQDLAKTAAGSYAKMISAIDNPVGRLALRPFLKSTTYQQMISFILPLARSAAMGLKSGEDHLLYEAPCALMFHSSAYASAEDTCIACTYAMLEAEAMGLGSCMIGSVPPVLARNKPAMKRFGIPEGQIPRVALILGHPRAHFLRTVKRPLHSIQWA